MKHLVAQAGRSDEFEIDSAAVSMEEIGNDIYPPAKRMLTAKGVPFEHRAARQITRADYAYYDHIVCMDQSNLRWLRYIIPSDPDNKVSLMMAWAITKNEVNRALAAENNQSPITNIGNVPDVSDPWYTGDFTKAYNDILEGCQAMLSSITSVSYLR